MRKLLLFSTIASLYLASCGNSDTSTYTLRGAVLASKVKGVKVCEAGTINCSVTNENGYYTLTVHKLPVRIELKVGNLVLGDAEVSSTQPEDTVITPLDIAEGNKGVAEKIGALIHALSGDISGNAQVVDLSKVHPNVSVHVEDKIKKGEQISLNLDNGHQITVSSQGVVIGNQQVIYDINHIHEEETEVCQELSPHQEEVVQQEQSSGAGQQEQTNETAQQEQSSGAGQQERNITIRGLAYDSEVDSGTARFYKVNSDGSLTQITQVNFSGGEFSFNIPEDQIENNAKYVVKVEGRIGNKEIKFISTLGSGETITSKAQENNGEVSQEEIPELVVSNVSTADYLLLRAERGNLGEIEADEIDKLLAEVKALKLDERVNVSAAIKAYVDEGAQLREGINGLGGLVSKVIQYVSDDGELTTSELKKIFATEDDIGKFGKAIVEVKKDNNLKKVLTESANSLKDQELENAVKGKTFYYKESEYAPLYQKITFKNDGTFENHVYVFTGDENGGHWQEEEDISKVPLVLKKWKVSDKKLHIETDAGIKYIFNVLSTDDDKIVGIASIEDDSNINWLSSKYAMVYNRNTYQDLESFASQFSDCDLQRVIEAYESGNLQTAQSLESHCFLGAFKFDTQNKKIYFSVPEFDLYGHLTGVKDVEFGYYEINGNTMKIFFTPVKCDEYRMFPDNFKPLIYVRLVDQNLAQQAQEHNSVLMSFRALNEEEPPAEGEGQPQGEETQYTGGEGQPQEGQPEGEGSGTPMGGGSVTPQAGNVIILFAADDLKMTFYKKENLVQSFMTDPFAMYGTPAGEQGQQIEMGETFERYVCREFIKDQHLTLKDVDNENNQVEIWCENNELKLRYNNGQAVDYDEDTQKLSSCPFFSNANCTVVDATETGITVCKLVNNEPQECKFFANQEKLNEFAEDFE